MKHSSATAGDNPGRSFIRKNYVVVVVSIPRSFIGLIFYTPAYFIDQISLIALESIGRGTFIPGVVGQALGNLEPQLGLNFNFDLPRPYFKDIYKQLL